MIPISIQCSCGHTFTFEIEPVDGRMPQRVGCPACGIDVTDAAEECIRMQLAAVPASATGIKTGTVAIIGVCAVLVALLASAGAAFFYLKHHSAVIADAEVQPPAQEASARLSVSNAPSAVASATASAVNPAPAVEARPQPPAEPPSAPVAAVAPRNIEPPKRQRAPDDVAVGVLFDRDVTTQDVKIVKVLPNSPGKKAGIVVGDVLIAVDDQPIEQMPLKDIADMFFGPVGTKISLTFIRAKSHETNRLEIVRKKYQVPKKL